MPPAAHAGLWVTLIPTLTQSGYQPGQVIHIDVYGQLLPANGTPSSLPVEYLRFDFSDTDHEVPIYFYPTHPNTQNGDISFWNFSTTLQCAADSSLCGAAYSIDDTISSDELVDIALNGPGPDATGQFFFYLDRQTLLGSFEISYPLLPGTYSVDVLNANEVDVAHGGEFRSGDIVWRASDGEITGGRVTFWVPEPSGLTLLLLGLTLTISRRGD